jgi:[NiFe] hydrogenase diaphorase moiety large subunit
MCFVHRQQRPADGLGASSLSPERRTMNTKPDGVVREICLSNGSEPGRLLTILREVQRRLCCVSDVAVDVIAAELSIPRVEVESLISFYSFLTPEPAGRITIRLCDDVPDTLAGSERVANALAEEMGVPVGGTTPDGALGLQRTACIGMSDQAPAAIVNDVVVTHLTASDAQEMVRELRQHADPRRLVRRLGDGNNAHDLVHAMVNNNLRLPGPVIFGEHRTGAGLSSASAMSPVEVIKTIKTSRLRGRGGAGFPTGLKWEFARAAEGDRKYVLCNADEGEPGTFKDRVILTERPELMFEGMAIAGYAIGADTGIVYLRNEYVYLEPFLDHVLDRMRGEGWLSQGAGGIPGFSFDIRIQMGAGAYICGEESALISSLEGTRGDPKNRPPFPAQKGYLDQPSVVNNVESFCCAARIMAEGAGWFSGFGCEASTGTKLLSISGDCFRPGVYEFEFGVKLSDVLDLIGAKEPVAVQIGGAAGKMVGPEDFERTICYDDLVTGGSVIVFGPDRDVVEIAREFTRFFVDESCGYCTPCRVGTVLLLERLDRIMNGRGEPADLDYLRELGSTIIATSRCGLGQTSPNPVLSTLEHFPEAYTSRLREPDDRRQPGFRSWAARGNRSSRPHKRRATTCRTCATTPSSYLTAAAACARCS